MNNVPLVSRIAVVFVAISFIGLAIYKRDRVNPTIKNFFTEATHPLNLAVFRISIFLTIIRFTLLNDIVWFSQMPDELLFLPDGLGWLFNYLPIDPTWAKATSILLLFFCFTGAIGLFSRTSALLTVILGFYVLGIPQLWGKVNHYNHLVWLPAILAASRCGDFFSVDAVLAAWKRADRGITEPPKPSRIYSLPLRFVWLIIGLIYFFSGFWKSWTTGFDWFWSDNLTFHAYRKWVELDGWTPWLRLDHYPLLSKFLAFGAIVWEVGFIILIFLPGWRLLAAFSGLAFHNMTNVFMRISFWTLQTCYVAFFDWFAIFNRLGKWMFPKPMYVLYNGNCKLSRRAIASLRVFDLFGRLTYLNVLEPEALVTHDVDWLSSGALVKDIHAVVDRKSYWRGFAAYRVISARIPLLWIVLPLLYLPPLAKVGDRIYRRVADRTSNIVSAKAFKSVKNKSYSLTPVFFVGILIVSMNIFYSVKKETQAWPFSCYPTFDTRQGETTQVLDLVPLTATGEVIPFSKQIVKKNLSPPRVNNMMKRILNIEDTVEQQRRLQGFWQLMVQNDPNLQQAESIQFYRVKLWVAPELQAENPVSKEFVSEFEV